MIHRGTYDGTIYHNPVAVHDESPGPSGVEAVLRMAKARELPVVLIHPDTGKIKMKL